jgi:nitrogen regulatory protein P-II 2
MQLVTFRLVTIIAEALLEDRLVRTIQELGATGYSIGTVRGEGSRGVHASEWEGSNIKIEVIVNPELADRILQHVAESYFDHWAVIAYVQPVDVLRSNKFAGS